MKTNKIFSYISIFILTLTAFMITGCSTPDSFMARGNKSMGDVKEMQTMISRQIESYEGKVKDLKGDNVKLLCWLDEDSLQGNNVRIYRAKIAIRQNDSLVGVYLTTIGELRSKSNSLYSELSTEEENIKVFGRPKDVSNAYIGVKYANGGGGTRDTLWGVVENLAPNCQSVVAKVTGPGEFYVEFTLDNRNNKKSPIFRLPMPGIYMTTFYGQGQYTGETRAVSKRVGPGIIYYDGSKKLDFKATLVVQ